MIELDINSEQHPPTAVKTFNGAIRKNESPFIPYERDGRRTTGLKPNKTNWAQRIDTLPYRAYAVVCGLTTTYGGLKTTERVQVLDTSDQTIEGLYTVGEVTGGSFYYNYPGGTGLIRGAVMGRFPGAQAAANL